MYIPGVFDFTVSGIDGNGFQYYTGMLEPERLDSHGMRVGSAFHIGISHSKSQSSLWTFQWIGGVPHNWEHIKTFKGEVLDPSETEQILKKYKLID